MRRTRRSTTVVMSALIIVAASLAGGNAAQAQIPEEFTNLQFFPEDISRGEIIGVMRGFAGALGVRCSYCHTVSNQLNQPDDDFASDAKANKHKARLMLEMVRRINQETLAMLPERASPPVQVTCNTCHAGITRPVPIDELVEGTIEADGITAAAERYRDLRARYHGSRAYDFSFAPLNALAERLLGQERAADAVAMLELNVEFNPTSPPTLLLLGQAHERNNDNPAARAAYQRIIDLDPATQFYDFYAGQARERMAAIGG